MLDKQKTSAQMFNGNEYRWTFIMSFCFSSLMKKILWYFWFGMILNSCRTIWKET